MCISELSEDFVIILALAHDNDIRVSPSRFIGIYDCCRDRENSERQFTIYLNNTSAALEIFHIYVSHR